MENKYEWLYNNCINGNWRDARKYMNRKSKKFLIGFIDYLNEFNEIEDEHSKENMRIVRNLVR
jgi:hypothetical protein